MTTTVDHRTLIVGYDGSPASRAAFHEAASRAGPDDAIVVVHATPPAASWLGAPYYDDAVVDATLTDDRLRSEIRELARESAATVDFETIAGRPEDVLLQAARARGASEIVVGSRGLGRLRAALGSVSQSLLRRADTQVTVVGGDKRAVTQSGFL